MKKNYFFGLSLSVIICLSLYSCSDDVRYSHNSAEIDNGENIEDNDVSLSRETCDPLCPPSIPILSTPTNGQSGVSINPGLNWNPSANADYYQVQVASNNTFSNPVLNSSTEATGIQVSSLNYATTYYWRVRAAAEGFSGWSSTWSFTTVMQSPPNSPTLLLPTNNSTIFSVSPTLSWSQVNNAQSYNIQVSTDASFGNVIINHSNIAGTSLPLTGLNYNTSYYWHVRASNTAGMSAWSSTWKFTTISPLSSVILFDFGSYTYCKQTDGLTNQTPAIVESAPDGYSLYFEMPCSGPLLYSNMVILCEAGINPSGSPNVTYKWYVNNVLVSTTTSNQFIHAEPFSQHNVTIKVEAIQGNQTIISQTVFHCILSIL